MSDNNIVYIICFFVYIVVLLFKFLCLTPINIHFSIVNSTTTRWLKCACCKIISFLAFSGRNYVVGGFFQM